MAMIHPFYSPWTCVYPCVQNASGYWPSKVMEVQVEANPGNTELLKDNLGQFLYFADEETEAQNENYIIFDWESIVDVIQSDLST